jgi:hypothetical protein
VPAEKAVSSNADGQPGEGFQDRIFHGPSPRPKKASKFISFFKSIVTAPNELQYSTSNVSSNLSKLLPAERHQLTPIVVVV